MTREFVSEALFAEAFARGRADGRCISAREAEERWPDATSEEIDVLLNAYEDGVRDDPWRLLRGKIEL